ncbi:GIP [Symbiodinium sp. CCMP2456]|nr:GIP [Symbiodinium sp. CCMP2456]
MAPQAHALPFADPLGALVQGMAQLQTAMSESLTSRTKEPEVVKPGLSELPKLAELGQNSAIDVGDWLHGLQKHMGDLSNNSGQWWAEILTCLSRYYEAYLAASHVGKLTLKADDYETDYLKSEKWARVDKRASSMILASVPETVKAELLSTRLVGTLAMLARVVVLYRPGSLAERQQVLRALESPSQAANAAEAVNELRKWARWLARATDIGVQCPDASVLVKGLDNIVKKVLPEHVDISFRVSMLRYTLEVDTRPTVKGARDLQQALMSELEQVAFRARAGNNPAPSVKAASVTTSTATTGANQGQAQGTGSPTGQPKAKSKPACRFFLTDKGCSKGSSCTFSHAFTRKEKLGRCWTCGSTQHHQPECPVKAGSGSPTAKAGAAAKSSPTVNSNSQASSTTTTTASTTSAASAGCAAEAPPPAVPETELKSLLEEASAMLKEIRQLKTLSLTVTNVQNQAVGVGCNPEDGRTGLLDSGASHPFREADDDEMMDADQVRVQLAGGREAVLSQGRHGTLLAKKTGAMSSAPIVPLGALVEELGCQISWSRRGGLVIRHPQHGVIRPAMVGRCPAVGETQALDLIREIESRKLQTLENATRVTAKALWLWDKEKPWARHLEDFVKSGGRAAQLAAMTTKGSPFALWTDLQRSLLAENIELSDRAGWAYLRAVPGSRQRRKRMMTLPWVIHLYSGPGRALDPVFRELDDGRVMVQVDINRSKAEDMNMVAGVYRALLWAAATGRVDGIFGSPPQKPELVQRMMWLSVVAKAARAAHGGHPAFVLLEGQKIMKLARKGEVERWSSVSSTWEGYMDVACLEEVGDNVVTNLKLKEPLGTTTEENAAWTVGFKQELVEAIKQWGREPEALQVMKWMKKLDAESGKFLEGFTEKELEMWRTHVRNNHELEGHIVVYAIPDYRYLLIGAYVFPRDGRLDDGTGIGAIFGDDDDKDFDPMEEIPEGRVKGPPVDGDELRGLSQEEFNRIFNEVGKELDYDTVYVARPLRTRTASEVTAAAQELVLKLGAEGCHVSRVHTDRARELRVEPLRRWLLQKGILVTYTEGQSPQANGRAEAAVKWTKSAVKRLLGASGLGKENWAVAANYAVQAQMDKVPKRTPPMLPFGTRVHVRSKVYGTGGRYDLNSRWQAGVYVGPSLDVKGGHVIRLESGSFMTSTHLRPHLLEPDRIAELAEYEVSLPMPIRRLRSKVAARDLEPVEAPDELNFKYDPEHPAELFAKRLLEEDVLTPDQCEILALMLPSSTATPKRFGPQGENQKVWSAGAFVHGGVLGVKRATGAFPSATRVFTKYVRQLQPDHEFNAVAVTVDVGAQQHVDAHNVGKNLIAGLSYFKGGGLEVEENGEKKLLPLDGDHTHQLFDPRQKHSTKPWYGGSRTVLIAYSVRDSGKLQPDKIDYLKSFGFSWTPHMSKGAKDEEAARLHVIRVGLLDVAKNVDVPEQHRDSPEQGGASTTGPEGDVPEQPRDSPEQGGASGAGPSGDGLEPKETSGRGSSMFESLSYLTKDVEVAIGDLEDRAARLRDLLEEEEIMCEEYRRVGQATRENLVDARSQVCDFLDHVHEELVGFERLRTMMCLNAMKVGSEVSTEDDVDYEALLESLEEDLKVVYTVPVAQVRKALAKWTAAIRKEVDALFSSGTLRRVAVDEAKKLESEGSVIFAPAKCVFTLKPPQVAGQRARRKARLVICGNFVRDNAEFGDLYAAGSSTDALRLTLVVSAMRRWVGAISDITGAFLLATWPENLPKYGIYPPRIVRDAGAAQAEAWIVERPLYGLRESPRIWCDFRNRRLKRARIHVGDLVLVLRPTVSEPELWMILEEITGTLHGLIVLYVDDIAYFSTPEVVRAVHAYVVEEWPASDLEWISESNSVRYLGVEIGREARTDEQGEARFVYTIGQAGYVRDLLRAHGLMDVTPTALPAPKEWIENAENDDNVEEYDESTLRLAQRYVGELLWLGTRTRPDVMFVVSHAASCVSKKPGYVVRLGQRVMAYLAGTTDLKMTMGPVNMPEQLELIAFTDASYAPFGRRSFGAAVITFLGSPIAWKAGRQSFVTLSVMESELYAATQGCTLLNSVYALLQELCPQGVCRVLAVDNTSAVSMLSGGHGSQRTRHLKIRAHYVREAVEAGELIVRHTPGSEQLADLSTKMQSKLRLQQLLRLWGFVGVAMDVLQAMKLKLLAVFVMTTLGSAVCSSDLQAMEEGKKAGDRVPAGFFCGKEEDDYYPYSDEGCYYRNHEVAVAYEYATDREDAKFAYNAANAAAEFYFFGETCDASSVAKDTLQLMTCEDLKSALRMEGMPVSGVKSDLADRLMSRLAGCNVTNKQLRYVLYLWRVKSLNYKCKLRWEDINSKYRISAWIAAWKDA